MRILQLSDPHLLADPTGRYRDRVPLHQLRHALIEALGQLRRCGESPDLLLFSGDLCQDESWGGYGNLRDLLHELRLELPALAAGPQVPRLALLPGNHDHGALLKAALGRQAVLAPAALSLGPWSLVLLDSHRPGSVAGWLGPRQLSWLAGVLAAGSGPVLLAVHHQPLAIGAPGLDAIGLRDGAELLALLAASPRVRGVVFGHIHQHWAGSLPGRPDVPLLGCPSTLCPFPAVQPCPLGRSDDPGGRLLELADDGLLFQRLLRWPPPDLPSLRQCS